MYCKSAIGLLLAFLLVLSSSALAQIQHGGEPASFSKSLTVSIDTKMMPSVDVDALMAEDAVAPKDEPMRFGNPFDVNYDLKNSGTWTVLPNGDRIWRLRIMSRDAISINLIFDRWYMPDGAQMFVYNLDKTHVRGAFNSSNNKATGDFAIAPVKGDVIIVEYFEPAAARDQGDLSISRVVHAYVDLFKEFEKGFGDAGSCNNNVHCPEAADWQDQVRANCMIMTSGGSRLCSGSMVNNVRQDLTPYFLTANHCLGGESTWIIVFNYESPNCTNIDGPLSMTVANTTLRASASSSDFALLELSSSPPESYNVYYNGWNAINTASPNAVGIHHPSGDIKKISWENDPITSSNYLGLPNSGDSHWRVEVWDDGTTEPGSSGSPLYDNNKRVIGQLHGGWAACNFDTADYYGKFARSWNDGASASSRLKDWLDPDNTGALVLDGRNQAGVSIVHDPLPNTQDTTNDYTVLATITSSGSTVSSTDLIYDVGAGNVTVAMTSTLNPDEYGADIPAQSPGTVINYYMIAEDLAGEADTTAVFTFRVLDYGVEINPAAVSGVGAVDDTVDYNFTLYNTGIFDDSYTLGATGNVWPTSILDETGTTPLTNTGTIVSNDSLKFLVRVIVPTSFYGDVDSAIVTALSNTDGSVSGTATVTTTSAGEPISLPFFDDFPSTAINIGLWVEIVNVEGSDVGTNETSAPYAARLNGNPNGADTLISQAIDLDGASDVALTYYYQQTGGGDSPEAGDDLYIEYLDNTASWQLVKQHLGADPDMSTFEEVVFYLPPAAYHSGFRLRFRSTGTSGAFDDWFVDNVTVDVTFPPDIDVTPLSFTEYLGAGDSTTGVVDILNTGLGGLTYSANIVQQPKSIPAFERLKALGEVAPAYREYEDGMLAPAPGKDEPDLREGFDVTKDAGGPDAFGYLWIDSDEPGGPTFVWDDVSGTGTDITAGFTDDSFQGPYDLGFSFPYYGNTYSQIYISSNGVVGFSSASVSTLSNAAIPTAAAPNAMIAWCWDDLNPADATSNPHVYIDTTGGKCVVQFTDVAEYQSGGGGDAITAQVVLNPDGTITLHYLEVEPGFITNEATIGIENEDGTDGLEVAFNAAYIKDSLSVRFYAPYIWCSLDKASGIVPGSGSDQLTLTFRSAELDSGTYNANLVITSNDPDESPVTIPLELNVDTGPSYVCGDVNGDGNGPNLTDLTMLVNYLFLSGATPPNLAACDVNASGGNPNLTDVSLLVAHLFTTNDPITCP